MDSLFHREPVPRPLTIYERLAPEIAHLQKSASSRHAKHKPYGVATWTLTIALVSLIGLFFMDPFVYAMKRSDAIRAYLYLHTYDSEASVQPLLASHIISENEAVVLNHRAGSYQNYFASHQDAEAKAAAVVAYMNGVQMLHNGVYESLDPIGKLRYFLFVRSGVEPPIFWRGLNPSIE